MMFLFLHDVLFYHCPFQRNNQTIIDKKIDLDKRPAAANVRIALESAVGGNPEGIPVSTKCSLYHERGHVIKGVVVCLKPAILIFEILSWTQEDAPQFTRAWCSRRLAQMVMLNSGRHL